MGNKNKTEWHRRLGAVMTVAGLAVAGGVACGNDGGSAEDGEETASSTVTIEGFEYLPAELTVEASTSIVFTNQDGQAHTATADASDGFDSGSIAAGEPATVEVAEPGRYPYHCSFHPFMTATVIVE